jgi:hypothetical protein
MRKLVGKFLSRESDQIGAGYHSNIRENENRYGIILACI